MTDCGSTMSPLKHFKFPSGPLGAGNNCFSGHLFSCVEDSSPKRIQARSQFYFKAHTHIYGHACTEMHTRRHTQASPERAAAWPPPAWMSVPVLSPQGGAPAQPWLPRAPV